MTRFSIRRGLKRRGLILVLSALMIVFILGLIAFSVDLGYIMMAKTQLQTAADSAALAAGATMGFNQADAVVAAKEFGGLNKVGKTNVRIENDDIVFGIWESGQKLFTPTANGLGNAVKVTVKADATRSGSVPLFFGAVFDKHSVDVQASAIATANPRDICFVVDLSSSMNDDTDPANVSGINNNYPGVGDQMMQKFFDDMNFGTTYPGTEESIGTPLTTSWNTLISTTSSPLRHSQQPLTVTVDGTAYTYAVPSQYRIYTTGDGSGMPVDTTATATVKAYKWVIDEQMGGRSGSPAVPGKIKNAKPDLDSGNGSYYAYWKGFVDYLRNNSRKVSYLNYVRAFEPKGRDTAPFSGSCLLSPMSVDAPHCVWHSETTDAGVYQFPAAEMPTHSARRAIIGAIKVIMDRNQYVNDPNQQDWVSIVTYSTTTNVQIAHPLDIDYQGAIMASTRLQATGYSSYCTATETGLKKAIDLFLANGRHNTNKVVVLLTDGLPNLYVNNPSAYMAAHPNSNYGSNTSENSALMQASVIQGKYWSFFPIETGLQGNASFMNRLYSVGKGLTNQTDTSPYSATGDPSTYEAVLGNLFNQIVNSPKVRLVQ